MASGKREIDPDEIDASFVPRPRDGVTAVELDGEGVLYSEETGGLHVLNPTATLIWTCFDGSGTIDDIVGELAGAFGTDREVVAGDVMELVRELGSSGVLAGVRPADG